LELELVFFNGEAVRRALIAWPQSGGGWPCELFIDYDADYMYIDLESNTLTLSQIRVSMDQSPNPMAMMTSVEVGHTEYIELDALIGL